MARKPPKLKVQFSPRARYSLDEIWEWNARKYNAEHAESYIAFLEKNANGLAATYLTGKIVPTAPELRYIIIRRNPRGHGHVAIYKIVASTYVNVVNFFHTSQDWQGKLARGDW
jgi:plasmid stabilization system protein ParE